MSTIDGNQVPSFNNYGESEWKAFLQDSSYRGLKINKVARHFETAQKFSFENNSITLTQENGKVLSIDMVDVAIKREQMSISRLIHKIRMLFSHSDYAKGFNDRIGKLAKALTKQMPVPTVKASGNEEVLALNLQAEAFNDPWSHIFSFLRLQALSNVRLVCKAFQGKATNRIITDQCQLASNIFEILGPSIKQIPAYSTTTTSFR